MASVTRILGIIFIAALVSHGCVELNGQRIVWSYDKGSDTLTMLLFYDGISDSKSQGNGQASEQLRAAVGQGDIMLLDWPFHLKRDEIQRSAEKPDVPLEVRAFASKYLTQVTTRIVGRYTDGAGRLGIAQQVTIKDASGLIASANKAISAGILQEWGDNKTHKSGFKVSTRLLVAAARTGHAWIRLDGQALVVDIPAFADDVRAMRARLAEDVLSDAAKKGPLGIHQMMAGMASITSNGGAFIQDEDRVQLRLGFKTRPETMRFMLRCHEDRSLDPLIKELVPAEVTTLPDWAPPEARAAILIKRAPKDAKAAKALEAFGRAWNDAHDEPLAPVLASDKATWLADWETWRAAMAVWPLKKSQCVTTVPPPEKTEPKTEETK